MVRNYCPIPEEHKKAPGRKAQELNGELIEKVVKDFSKGIKKKKICEKYNITYFMLNNMLATSGIYPNKHKLEVIGEDSYDTSIPC